MQTGDKKLCQKEREILFKLRKEGLSFREIGKILDRSHTTLSREIRRNSGKPGFESGYTPSFAEKQARHKRYRSGRKPRLSDPVIKDLALNYLKQGYSPNVISGLLSKNHPELSVCHETIYRYLYQHCAFDLSNYLPTGRWQRKKRGLKRKTGVLRDRNRILISQRREEINDRKELGHWESDSVVSSKSKTILNVSVERKSRYVQITKLKDSSAQQTYAALYDRLKAHGANRVKSITFDNGTENACYKDLEHNLKIETYFCLPYHSWEKGSVENMNKLIRQFIPKGTDLEQISVEEIRKIEETLNSRPRKILGYRTPLEDFNSFP